jgi:hypothetical protein
MRHAKGTATKLADAQNVIAQAGETVRAQIVAIREQIEDLRSQRFELETGSLPLADVQPRIDAMIDRAAGDVDLEYHLSSITRANGRSGECRVFDVITKPGQYNTGSADVGPLLCALFGDQIKQRLREFCEGLDLDGPPLAERPAMVRKIDAEILKLEREEERMICEAERAGIHR